MKVSHNQGRLVARAVRGEADAFAVLYRRYLSAAYRYFYFRAGNSAVAEQLTDRLFLRLWEALPIDPQLNKVPFPVWLLHHAHHVCTEYVSLLSALNISVQRPPLIAWSPGTRSEDLPHLNPRYLAAAIIQLQPLEQQVIVLRFILQLPHREIALILDDTEEGINVLQYRAILALQEVLTRKTSAENAFALEHVTTATFCIDRVIADTTSIQSSLDNVAQPTLQLKCLLQFVAIVARSRNVAPSRQFENSARQRMAEQLQQSIRPPLSPTDRFHRRHLQGHRLFSWLTSILSSDEMR